MYPFHDHHHDRLMRLEVYWPTFPCFKSLIEFAWYVDGSKPKFISSVVSLLPLNQTWVSVAVDHFVPRRRYFNASNLVAMSFLCFFSRLVSVKIPSDFPWGLSLENSVRMIISSNWFPIGLPYRDFPWISIRCPINFNGSQWNFHQTSLGFFPQCPMIFPWFSMDFPWFSQEFPWICPVNFPGGLPLPRRHLGAGADLGRLSGRGHGPHVAQGGGWKGWTTGDLWRISDGIFYGIFIWKMIWKLYGNLLWKMVWKLYGSLWNINGYEWIFYGNYMENIYDFGYFLWNMNEYFLEIELNSLVRWKSMIKSQLSQYG